MVNPKISIIGLGRLGSALKRSLEEVGYTVSGFGREKELTELGDLIFVTTSDQEISTTVKQLETEDLRGKIVIHCSGLVSVEVLSPLQQKGADTGSFHPNQAVTEKTQNFKGTVWDVVGEENLFSLMESIADSLGGKAISISEEQKQYLHIAAVMASNYQVTLMHLSQKIAEEGELDASLVQKAMLPLMKSVLGNLEELPPDQALTGPIARGDEETLQQHVKLLKNNPKLLNIYNELGKITVDMVTLEKREEVDQRINALFNK